MTDRKKSDLTVSRLRSRITNGSQMFFKGVDERGPWCRRLRDLLRAHEADLGGSDILSEGQRAIVRRIAALQLQLEMLENRFAENDGEATGDQLMLYQRGASALRRLLESVGLHQGRQSRDITPDVREYVRQRYGQPAEVPT